MGRKPETEHFLKLGLSSLSHSSINSLMHVSHQVAFFSENNITYVPTFNITFLVRDKGHHFECLAKMADHVISWLLLLFTRYMLKYSVFKKIKYAPLPPRVILSHTKFYSDMYFWWDFERFGKILCEIRWDFVRFSEIWWDMVRFCKIQWNLVSYGEIWWELVRFCEI